MERKYRPQEEVVRKNNVETTKKQRIFIKEAKVIHAREDYNRIQDPAGKIPIDEPVFLIRGQDIAGPDTVEEWAKIAEKQGAKSDIVEAARGQAEAMRIWQRNRASKTPDLPQDFMKMFMNLPVGSVAIGAAANALANVIDDVAKEIRRKYPEGGQSEHSG